MASAAAIFGIASLAALLGVSCYILRKLGAEEIAQLLAAIAVFGFLAALAGALLS